jgi:hypothetical protein
MHGFLSDGTSIWLCPCVLEVVKEYTSLIFSKRAYRDCKKQWVSYPREYLGCLTGAKSPQIEARQETKRKERKSWFSGSWAYSRRSMWVVKYSKNCMISKARKATPIKVQHDTKVLSYSTVCALALTCNINQPSLIFPSWFGRTNVNDW